jgi:hypothetical protein
VHITDLQMLSLASNAAPEGDEIQMNLRRVLYSAMLLLALRGYLANAQMLSGTVVVAIFTKQDLVIAADSRSTAFNDSGQKYSFDNECKVAAVNGKIVFAISGYAASEGSYGFDLRTEAQTLASSADIRSEADLLKLADAWATRANALFDRFASHKLQVWKSNPMNQSTAISDAIFGSRDMAGNIIISVATIHPTRSVDSPPFTSSDTFVTSYPRNHAFTSGYGSSVMAELRAGKSTGSILGSNMLDRLNKSITVPEMERVSLDFTQLVAQQYPDMVGGSIDQVHLGPNGIQWVHRKPNCAQTYP